MTTDAHAGRDPVRDLFIVLLEDRESDRNLIRENLHEAGLNCRLCEVSNRGAFAEALHRGGFDLILADYSLPGFDGAAALALAKELSPDTPFIFVSGAIEEQKAIDTLKSGATDYVLKDRMERLVPAVNRALKEVSEQRRRHLAEERLREMAENISEVFWSASADGRHVHYVSPAYELVWDRPLTELMVRPDIWLESIHPEDREKVLQVRDQLAQGRPYTLEYRLALPSGGHRWIEERGYPVANARGQVLRSVGVALDVTKRKSLEDQLQQAQKMEAIGQLAGGIAHDFGNMLTVINGYSNLLLDNREVPPAVVETLRHIFVAGGRAANLTRQLLIFSRKSQPRVQLVDLNEVVDEAATMLRRMIGEDIRLELDLAHPLPRTLADTGMLEQVLMNLAANARDAMPEGGNLVISTGSCEIAPSDKKGSSEARPGVFVWLGVRDTGCGIPAEIMARIFEPFFTTKGPGKGTGLGLATVFGIARQHQGWAEVESEPGSGTLFRVFLPITTAEQPAKAPHSADPFTGQGRKEIVLLVEDETLVRDYARTVLEMNGYKVLQAATGIQALDVWKWHRTRISLLLTDVVMPDDMTGLQLADRLRKDRPDLPVLFCSGYSDESTAETMKGEHAFSFLHKPYQPKTLARMVREMIDHGVAQAGASQAPFS
jgi:two-component system, cell cycle sensor histidine kinase and response regulator CckA